MSNEDDYFVGRDLTLKLGHFDLDPCTDAARPWSHADNNFTKKEDGLSTKWVGRVWCHPPYDNTTPLWVERMMDYKKGILMLFFEPKEKWFQSLVIKKATTIFVLEDLMAFHKGDGTLGPVEPCQICLIAYSEEDKIAITQSMLDGYYFEQET